MFILGILSLFQIWFLPGLFFLSFSKKLELLDMIILSVPLSITINYFLVYFLVNFEIYSQFNLLLIIIFEISYIIYNSLNNIKLKKSLSTIENFLVHKNEINIKLNILDILILLCFFIISFLGFQTIGEVIHIGDAIRSYNPWSIIWFNNKIDDFDPGIYTQGLPILMSVSYKLINNTNVEFFARALIVIYPIWVYLIYYRASHIYSKYKIFIKISLIISSVVFLYILRNYAMFIGYVEPITYLTSVSTLYIISLIFFFEKKFNVFEYIIFVLVIISNPLLKPTGFHIIATLPLLYLVFLNTKKVDKIFTKLLVIFSIISIPFFWLFNKLLQIFITKTSSSNIDFILSINTSTLLEKLISIFSFMWVPCIFFSIYGLINKKSLIIFLIITLPYLILYYFLLGYDNRHFLIILPFMSLNITFGIYELYKRLNFSNISLPNFLSISFFVFFFFVIIFFINAFRGDERLINSSISKKMLRGDIQINTLLYHYAGKDNFKIISVPNYLDFEFLPLIGHRVEVEGECLMTKKNIYDQKFYLIVEASYCKKQIGNEWLNSYLNNNFKILFEFKNYYLLFKEINN